MNIETGYWLCAFVTFGLLRIWRKGGVKKQGPTLQDIADALGWNQRS